MINDDYNLSITEGKVELSCGDYAGTFELDMLDDLDAAYKICEAHRIDTKNHFILGFKFSAETIIGLAQDQTLYAEVCMIHKKLYGETFEEIRNQIIANDGEVEVIRRTFCLNYKTLGKYIKRFDAFMVNEMSRYITQMNFIEE